MSGSPDHSRARVDFLSPLQTEKAAGVGPSQEFHLWSSWKVDMPQGLGKVVQYKLVPLQSSYYIHDFFVEKVKGEKN